MIIAQAQDLEQRFGGNTIFSNISFSVPDNARIGLVGPNGAGKTTLLKIMTGQQEPTSGQFTINKGLKVGYIAQENGLDEDKTCLLYTSPSPRDRQKSRMPSSA